MNWLIKFKRSRVFRTRFPVDSICGARLLVFNHTRPNASLPPPQGSCSVEQLGEFGDDDDGGGDRALPGTLEFCDESIEPIGVLILELSQKGEHCDQYERDAFASSILWPRSQRLRTRVGLDYDWTPNKAFSKSTRHYLVGDASEMKELANALMAAFPRLRMLLTHHRKEPGKTDEETRQRDEALENANTLIGNYHDLHPSKPPPAVQSLRSQLSFSMLEKANILAASAPPPSQAREPDGFASKDAVHDFLRRCGIKNPKRVNRCLKAGLLNGCVSVPKELKSAEDASEFLDTVLAEGECSTCGRDISCTVGMALNQAEMGSYGDGYESDAAINCGSDSDAECDGTYITNLCQGSPHFTSGKFHNHCEICPDFGTCIGDYRNSHCYHCGEHYFEGNFGFPCQCGGDRDDVELNMDVEGDEDNGELTGNDLALFVSPPQVDSWKGYVHYSTVDSSRG